MAYEKPSGPIQQNISQSEHRSRKWLREEHNRIQNIVTDARRKWNLLHKAIEDPIAKKNGEAMAYEARKRLFKKRRQRNAVRDEELQYLVEGQKSSIDAIQLKEHLVLPKGIPKVEKYFTDREKTRLEELLSADLRRQ
ncbi:hypothetical protein BC833DRAFT_586561 [Globomyces pollinis-pini]|nr:hypothetical protein BC833DRAFT_586561 [Globomyces pollinis-pini]